jgi:hypothetical protein
MTDPMSDERLAEIRERAESVKTWKGYHAEPVPQLLDVDVPALLAEVERLRAELAAIRTTETDVTWLADGVRRLILGVSVRTAKDPEGAQYTIAQEVASHINAGVLTSFVSSRVVDLAVEHIKKAEAERGELKAAARAAVLAGHYTARQQLIVDLTRLGVLSPDETRQAMQALDAAAGGTEAGR